MIYSYLHIWHDLKLILKMHHIRRQSGHIGPLETEKNLSHPCVSALLRGLSASGFLCLISYF
jgi:hypothetical protein